MTAFAVLLMTLAGGWVLWRLAVRLEGSGLPDFIGVPVFLALWFALYVAVLAVAL